jgi:hypothetical protein
VGVGEEKEEKEYKGIYRYSLSKQINNEGKRI